MPVLSFEMSRVRTRRPGSSDVSCDGDLVSRPWLCSRSLCPASVSFRHGASVTRDQIAEKYLQDGAASLSACMPF